MAVGSLRLLPFHMSQAARQVHRFINAYVGIEVLPLPPTSKPINPYGRRIVQDRRNVGLPPLHWNGVRKVVDVMKDASRSITPPTQVRLPVSATGLTLQRKIRDVELPMVCQFRLRDVIPMRLPLRQI